MRLVNKGVHAKPEIIDDLLEGLMRDLTDLMASWSLCQSMTEEGAAGSRLNGKVA